MDYTIHIQFLENHAHSGASKSVFCICQLTEQTNSPLVFGVDALQYMPIK